jgi:hypothetical protein
MSDGSGSRAARRARIKAAVTRFRNKVKGVLAKLKVSTTAATESRV